MAAPETLWFDSSRLPLLVALVLLFAAVLTYVILAHRGRRFPIRPIRGLQAVEEGIGRATEMGRPILYTSGVGDIRAPGVLASIGILGWVAELVARHGASLVYPVNNAYNLAIGQEVVRDAYLRAGRPDEYRDEMVYFISGMQFAYAAAVCGLMVREKTAAHFFFGSFWSETLVMTETGAATGAIQIAATDSEHQLPFFVATCDYVIIGEELFAASAYLTQDPEIVGSLRGQDVVKGVLLVLLVLGVLLATLADLPVEHHLVPDWLEGAGGWLEHYASWLGGDAS